METTLSMQYRMESGTAGVALRFLMYVSGTLSVVSECSQEVMMPLSEAEVRRMHLLSTVTGYTSRKVLRNI